MEFKKRVTLRVSILTVYTVTFIILMTTFIVAGSLNFNQAIDHVANDLMSDASNLVLHELEREITPAVTIVKATQALVQNGLIIQNDEDVINYSASIAKIFPKDNIPDTVRVASWADTKGNSILTFREDNGTFTTQVIKPFDTPPVNYQLTRDASGNVIRKDLPPDTFDARTRPWYTSAIKANNVIWTDIFIAYPYNNPSTSASAPIYQKTGELLGVFAIDIKLLVLSDFLHTLKIGKDGIAFIINADNNLVAYPGMQKWLGSNDHGDKDMLVQLNETDTPWLQDSLKMFKETGVKNFRYEYNGIRYLAMFQDINEFKDYGWKIAIVVPESNFIGLLKNKNLIIIIIGIIILIMGIITAMIFSKRISASMTSIVEETARMKDFHLEGGKVGGSIIKEVDVLASSIYSMKKNLRAFQKYLPSTLVRQLIESGEEVDIGGSKKQLTIFFSDIEGFTSITETMRPEPLMRHLCVYFDNLTSIIAKTGGTIDKFIGDSIMAFWGAPLTDEDHCQHACTAALACKQRLIELNTRWLEEGKPCFNTRIGINTGDAIVGNIGSSDRINYTVIGDAVNLASRLEQINRVYHSTITVSESVYKLVGDKFVFRMLDKVKLKGMSHVDTIYELLAETPAQLNYDIHQYRQLFAAGFDAYEQKDWAKAIGYFKQCLTVCAGDSLALVFIQRCENYLRTPPDADWTGVWIGE
jgi:adenylate cyclase